MVFACSIIARENSARPGRDGDRMEALYASQGQGQSLKEVARVVAMLGGLVLYACLLAVGSG
jgi:hypothetical protein